MRDSSLHIIRSIQKDGFWPFLSHILLSAAIALLFTYLLHQFAGCHFGMEFLF
jgi:hypothetical protein